MFVTKTSNRKNVLNNQILKEQKNVRFSKTVIFLLLKWSVGPIKLGINVNYICCKDSFYQCSLNFKLFSHFHFSMNMNVIKILI